MLSEREVRILYETAQATVVMGLTEVTIDVHTVEAEQHCKALAKVLEEEYVAPKRSR
jgi:hypothetical protein